MRLSRSFTRAFSASSLTTVVHAIVDERQPNTTTATRAFLMSFPFCGVGRFSIDDGSRNGAGNRRRLLAFLRLLQLSEKHVRRQCETDCAGRVEKRGSRDFRRIDDPGLEH